MATDVTQYARKAPTDYHKWFARWLVTEVGYNPTKARSEKEAFLRGVQLAVSARTAFQDSDFLEEMREKHGVTKRGPKPKAAKSTGKRRAAPEPDEDEFEDPDTDEDDDPEIDDVDFEDDEEETPPPRKRASKSAPAKKTAKPASKRRSEPDDDDDDDEFLF